MSLALACPKLRSVAKADDFEEIRPGLLIWQAYDRTVKADLFSTALATDEGLFVVDPIELDSDSLDQLARDTTPAGIIVTNTNHLRSADTYVQKFSVPLFAHRESLKEGTPDFIEVEDGGNIAGELQVIRIEGAPAGEIGLYYPNDGGTLVIGDALINFEPHGFAFLPHKYCEDPRSMRKSLQKLLRFEAERMLFAHGTPIVSGASARLRELLDVDLDSQRP